MKDGFLHCFRWKNVPVRMHWSVLALGAIELFTRKSAYALIAFAIIILAHELGHAVLVQRYRLKVREILIHPFGGECIHDPAKTDRQRVVIAWGGVLAQLALFGVAFALLSFTAVGRIAPLREILEVMTLANLAMAAFNLLPIRPLDGHTAWKLKHLRSRKPTAKAGTRPNAQTKKAVAKTMTARQQRELDALVDSALEKARSAAKSDERPK